MKKFFGIKSSSSQSPTPTPNTNTQLHQQRQLEPQRDNNNHNNNNPGLGLLHLDYDSDLDVDPQPKSKHVQFHSQDSYSSQPGPPYPSLHPQPSFDSRHGNLNSATSNCFPRASNDAPPHQLQHKLDTRLGLPKTSVPVGVGSDLQRTISPLSFSPSSISYGPSSRRGASPYGVGNVGMYNPSLARLADRDPSAIYQPLTWSEMAHQELVENLSTRERTRQEILWEVVASEERYVHELRNLVELYVNPLLHPLLSTPPTSPNPSPSSTAPSPSLHATSPTPSGSRPPSRDELPIAARFLRSISNGVSAVAGSAAGEWDQERRDDEMPEIDGSDSSLGGGRPNNLSRQSLPAPPRGTTFSPVFPHSASSTSLNQPPTSSSQQQQTLLPPDKRALSSGGRLSSFPGFRPRHPLRPAPSSTKLHKSVWRAPAEVLLPPPIPPGLRSVLEAIPEMLRGHEELSTKLKEQWIKAFPLVRGLALIWSDQPWFLEVYAKYIVSLEEALETIDICLPSNHSPHPSLTLLNKKPKTQSDKETKKLAKFIMSVEERASAEGEAGLAIAISKPLMRLGKLPLLMQSLLYHTDATTVEYEKTRAMALEVDALVRSIEDEKIEEDEREKVRDVLARIDGIKDKALMAPRSSRTLLEEVPVVPPSDPSPGDPPAPRRAVSESAPPRRPSASPPAVLTTKKSTKRLSDVVGRGGGGTNDKKDWFVKFSDVTIRCTKTGTTDIPGGFSREKEKMGKQGKTKKKGKTRNLYRFVRVERWEMREMSEKGLISMEDISRSRTDLAETLHETSEEDDDDDFDDGVSRMSFSYEGDDPKPSAPRNFKDVGLPRANTPRSSSRAASSSTTRSVISKQTPAANAKFGGRLPSSSVGPSGRRFEAPTAASMARASTPAPGSSTRNPTPVTRVLSPNMGPARNTVPSPTNPPSKRELSSPAMPSSVPPATRNSGAGTLQSKKSSEGKFGAHGRDASTIGIYEAYWNEEDSTAVPFPRA